MSTATKKNVGQKSQLPTDRLMTVRELAAYLSINERTLLKLVSEGALPGVKIGNQWRFRKVMIDAWLDDVATSGVCEPPFTTLPMRTRRGPLR